MIRWPSGSAKGARTSSPSSAVYRPGSEGDAPDAVSRARTERLLLDAKSAATPRHKLTLMDITAQHIAGHRSHYNPDQPRVPAGNPDGGQWTSAGGGTGSRLAAADKPRLGPRSAIAIAVEIAKQVIEAYRSKQGLWDLFGHKDGTIAFTTIDGTKVFGSNSTSPSTLPLMKLQRYACAMFLWRNIRTSFLLSTLVESQMMSFSTLKQQSY